MVYLRAGTVVQQPTFLEEVLALPIRIYHMLVFFLMTLIDPKAAKQGPGGSGAEAQALVKAPVAASG